MSEPELSKAERLTRLSRRIPVPLEDVETFVARNVKYLANDERTFVSVYYGIDGRCCVSMDALKQLFGEQYAIKHKVEHTLRSLANAEKAPADPLEQNVDEFFNPRRAHEAGVDSRILLRLVNCLKAEYATPEEPAPKIRRIIRASERELGDIRSFGVKCYLATVSMLATACLQPGMMLECVD